MFRTGMIVPCIFMSVLFAVRVYGNPPDAILDALILQLRQGRALGPQEHNMAHQTFSEIYNDYEKKRSNAVNRSPPIKDRTDHFITTLKMALIYPEQHGGWPFRSSLRLEVVDELMRRLDEGYDSFLLFCTIMSAYELGDLGHTVRAFETLMETDPFLAGQSLQWSAMRRQHSWIIEFFLNRGDIDRAKAAVDLVQAGDDLRWAETEAYLHERLGAFHQAEDRYVHIHESGEDMRPLIGFLQRNPIVQDRHGRSYRQRLDALRNTVFPDRMHRAGLHANAGPPKAGVILDSEHQLTRLQELRKGMVIVAVDGYGVNNIEQYKFVRDLKSDHPLMELVYWNNDHYVAMTFSFFEIQSRYNHYNRIFGVRKSSFQP